MDRSWNGTFLHKRRFLSYHGERFWDLSLLLEDDRGRLMGVFPAALDPDGEDLVNYDEDMRFLGFGRFGRVVPLVAAAFLLCFAAFICLDRLAAESGASTVLVATHHSCAAHPDNGAGGNENPTKAGHLAASMEDAKTGEEHPVNAELLSALLLVVFFGASLMLLGGRRILRRGQMLPIVERSLPSSPRLFPLEPAAPLLSVFRL